MLDSRGGDNLTKSLQVLRPGGIAVGIAGPPTPAFARQLGLNPLLRVVMTALSRRVRAQAKKLGVDYRFLFMRADGEQLRRIAELVDGGAIRPVVGITHPFDEAPRALEALHRGGTRGKSVLLGA